MSATSQTGNKQTLQTVKRAAMPDHLDIRWWRWLIVSFALATGIAFITYFMVAIEWNQSTYLGAMITRTGVVNASQPTSDSHWPGIDAGLQFQDEILRINGSPVRTGNAPSFDAIQTRLQSIVSKLRPLQSIDVTFRRHATMEQAQADGLDSEACQIDTASPGAIICTVTYSVDYFPGGDLLSYFIIPFISGLIVFAIGLTILRLRGNQPVALMASLVCFLTAIYMSGISDLGTTFRLIPLWIIATSLLGGSLVTLGLIFPMPLRITYRVPAFRFLPIIASVLIGAGALYIHYSITDPLQHGLSIQFTVLFLNICVFILGGLILFSQRPRASNLMTRDQSNSMLIGIALVIPPILIWVINRILQALNTQPLPFSFEAMMLFLIFPIAAIAYAVLQYRRVDTDQVISQGIAYSIMLTALIIGYFLLVLGVSFITQDALDIDASNPLLVAVTIFVIAAFFIPVRTRLQGLIDEIYFRAKRDYQQKVEDFGQKLTTLVNYRDIVTEFNKVLDETIIPESRFVFILDAQHGDYVAHGDPEPETDIHFGMESGVALMLRQQDNLIYLEPGRPWPYLLQVDRMRLTILKAMVLVSISSADQLNGFVIIGPPRSGLNAYTFEEKRFISNMVSQLSIAIERAQVINSLERRVSELDVLSRVGQAVNFTIEFDDLLELISSQTAKLIDAPNFYIAMHDPSLDQLYFAFFLEEDERQRDKEDVRWQVDRDLFSEIIRSGQPNRVDDYAREMIRRDAPVQIVNPHLRAWMGVPLIAGPRNLGVIAVAKIKSGETFTDEQFKIFNDIGALAATSIDKARLFNETEKRARQLAVLNEISRQLVATEMDVEKLLEIITSSAVEILDAEAGSLLLITDEAVGDLEFRVVIGGSGASLIGSKLKAGQGVVGKVAKTGEPVISNDAEHDPNHATDVTKDFQTDSLLAVPLIAKERVIGVLEVINKKDGTIFVEQDVELLSTFAGQGAVAIENARMFEMTGSQLGERVQELEMLERIDNELNRTLDLRQVAEITVRWAVSNTGAQAGALGIVTGTPPRLQIVGIHGYTEEEYPEGAEGLSWPLDEGIVKRVIRTRQADFAPYTDIDPDYNKGLKSSLSQITVPMKTADDISAILILETNQEPRFSLSNWAFAQRLAEHASIAIANAQLYDEITKANKSQSEFMGFAAHELKNPLTSVIGYADTVLKGAVGDLNDIQKQMLSVIRNNADRMQTIINDLRDSARLKANEFSIVPEPIDFRHVVVETLRPFQQQLADKEQEVVQDIPDDLPMIMGDQNRLIQLLTNLVSNAYKYSPPERTITIKAYEENYRSRRGQNMGKVLHIEVKDQGIGMSEEELERIFREQYFRSEREEAQAQPGTGLGMMITQGIVQGHGGEIWVESELGVGSSFHFVIPLAKETAESQSGAAD